MYFFRVLFSSCLFLLITTTAFSQLIDIRGKVVDENGLPMPGATVVIESLERGTVTDRNGNFTFSGITFGNYSVKVSYIGYASEQRSIMVAADQTESLLFALIPGVTTGNDVLVLGDRLKGQAKALNQQRTNENITNIVAADQIGRFPDANVGDAMKRIAGITMQNDQGEARDIIIRGISPELNSVMINGERMPSAESDNRRLQMDLIPADMIQTIEVNKAVLPSMDADAIGGAVNLVTRSAPGGLRVSTTAGSGYSLITEKAIWNGSIVVGDRAFKNKLGYVFSASYQNVDYGSDNYEARWVETDNPDYPVTIDRYDLRKYDVQRVRRSASLGLDYQFNSNHSLQFNSMYNWRDDWENRYRFRVDRLDRDVWDDSAPSSRFNPLANGLYEVRGRTSIQTKGGIDSDRVRNRRLEDQRLMNFTLSGDHLFNKLKLTWNATYARASEDRPNERYITHRSNSSVLVDVRNPYKALVTFRNIDDELNVGFNEIFEEHQTTFEEDFNARLDLNRSFNQDQTRLQGGLRLRTKSKERDLPLTYYEPIQPLGSAGDQLGALPLERQNQRVFMNGSQYEPGRFVTTSFLGNLDLYNTNLFEAEQGIEELAANYTSSEIITAAYTMLNHRFSDRLSAVAGLRLEHTSLEYAGFVFDEDNETLNPTGNETQSYLNVLPGIHFKYDVSDNNILRFAWTNTLARPNYFDLVPYALYSPDNQTLERGNPDLKATTAMNFDLMYESYFSSVGVFSAGLFYKDLNNFIYRRTIQNVTDPQFGELTLLTRPENGGSADVWGYEAAIQRQLDFLPGIWKGLGVVINYTRINSTTEGVEGRDNADLRLPGTARHMFNGSLSFENEKLVLRMSVNHASDYIDEYGDSSFSDVFYDRQTFLDFNGSYAFNPKWRFFAEVHNITNQPLRFYQGIRSRTVQEEFYNLRVNVGIKFDLFRN